MKILRIENSDGKGPYSGYYRDWTTHDHDRSPNHPNCSRQFIMTLDYFCGFINREQLENWFNKKELDNLAKLGYNIQVYEVPEGFCEFSYHQAIFIKNKAVKLHQIPIKGGK